jgi:multisubunit Na+/H+ antiporter MnhG subunit
MAGCECAPRTARTFYFELKLLFGILCTTAEGTMRHVSAILVAVVALVTPVGSSAQGQHSSQLVQQLSRLLTQRGLDAFAAAEHEAPDRFVATLAVPNSPLLVVEAKYPAPPLLLEQIAAKKYRDVYTALHEAGLSEGKLFFMDIGFDGLKGDAETVDVLYRGANDQIIFDGAPEKHKLTKAAYQQQLSDAEATYCHLLDVLLQGLGDSPTGESVAQASSQK